MDFGDLGLGSEPSSCSHYASDAWTKHQCPVLKQGEGITAGDTLRCWQQDTSSNAQKARVTVGVTVMANAGASLGSPRRQTVGQVCEGVRVCFTDVGRPTLNVGSSNPWAGIPN